MTERMKQTLGRFNVENLLNPLTQSSIGTRLENCDREELKELTEDRWLLDEDEYLATVKI